MNRPVRRLLAAFALSAVALSGVIGVAPRGTPPTDSVAGVGPSPIPSIAVPSASTGASPTAVSPPRISPSPGTAATRVPAASPGVPSPTASALHRPASATPLLVADLDARLERLRAKYGIPGISASILFADGSAWHGSAGLADVVAKRKVTDQTAFPVASVSKTFTSALILRLAEDRLLDLDASVRSYLPTLGISRAITVRELLDHTSGLRDFFFHPRIDHDLLTKPTLEWDAARSLKYLGKPYGKPYGKREARPERRDLCNALPACGRV